VHREWREPCDWTWKPAPTDLRWPLSNSALLHLLRSRMTCKNAGSHSGKRVIADKDEVGGSSPPRPTIRPLSSGNAVASSLCQPARMHRWSATRSAGPAQLVRPHGVPDQHVRRWSLDARTRTLGSIAVVERITWRTDGNAVSEWRRARVPDPGAAARPETGGVGRTLWQLLEERFRGRLVEQDHRLPTTGLARPRPGRH
jgi:hypothetical protein